MGFESRIIVVERTEAKPGDGGVRIIGTYVFGDELVSIDLCKMGDEEVDGKSFRDLFDKEIDFDLFVDGERTRKDKYGDVCKYTDISTVFSWLRESNTGKEYRRAKMLSRLLTALKESEPDYKEVCLVHYGY